MNGFEKYRTQAGYTQAQLASKLNLDRSTVTKWEIGAAKPRIETMLKLARMYGCRVEDILEGEKTA